MNLDAGLIATISAAAGLAVLIITQTGSIRSDLRQQAQRIDALGARLAQVEGRISRVEGMIDTLQSVLLADRGSSRPSRPSRSNRGAA